MRSWPRSTPPPTRSDRSSGRPLHAFADLVHAIPVDGWSGPGLGVWDLRALVGHASRALITLETYLGQPADSEDVTSAAGYLTALASVDSASVASRGVAAGEALGPDPVASVDALVARVLPLVDRPDDPLITTAAGGMRLTNYLPTRTLELVVHGFDIAAAAGLEPPGYSNDVLTSVAVTASTAAVRRGLGPVLIRALTGRARLPADFSVV